MASVIDFSDAVLRNVLEDTQQQQQGEVCTIPLAGDSDVSVWKLALGLIYRINTATITLDNAQGLLLLADKWNMECITDMVEKFLRSRRLKDSFTPATVSTWLTVFSKCGLEQHMQMCIDYIVSQETNVDIDMVYLQPIHANMLFAATQRKLSKTNSDLSHANSELRHASVRINKGNSQRDKLMQLYEGVAGFYVIKCSACGKCWISRYSVTCCSKNSATQSYVYLDKI